MRIGVPKEIKTLEFRVGLTPGAVHSLVEKGHEVFVETGAAAGIGLVDAAYEAAGAKVLGSADEVFAAAEMIVKVKEPQAVEIARLKPHHILFTYLHLAADKDQALGLMKSGATCIAYETVTDKAGRLPLLAPMSQVAGRMAVDVGAVALLKPAGGRGMLLGGVPGENAAEMAVGHRADVTIFDISAARLAQLDAQFDGRVKTAFATRDAIAAHVHDADMVVGCVLVTGAAAPKLVTRADLKQMRKGSVLVDVSIDQGGCFETSHATTHKDPTYEVEGIVHYCVANMPGAAPYTSTFALGASTIPYVHALADKGVDAAFADDPGLAAGLNVRAGKITYAAVAEALGL
jgi:alanine dehydrogenase